MILLHDLHMTWFFFISCQIIHKGEEKQSSEWRTQKDILKDA